MVRHVRKIPFWSITFFLDKDTRSPIALKCAFEVAVKDPNLHMALV